MKGSEAILRAVAAAGGALQPCQMDEWLGQLVKAAFLEKGPDFTYQLTDKAKAFLKGKGVEV